MKLYEIDSQYMEYLYKADSKVLIHNSGNHQRRFIAIKVLINGYKYFVPLSSPDKRDYYNDQDGHKKVQFTRVPTIKRIFNGNPTVESYLGKLLFNNMILVPEGCYHEFNVFLEKVLRSFKNQEDILRRAQIVYKLKKRKSSYNYIKLATVDFELLERNYDKWNKVFIK